MASRRSKKRAKRARRRAKGGDFRDRKRGSRGRGGIPIRAASFGGVKGAIARAVAKSSIGKRALTIARQQISRIPGVGRFAGRTRRAASGESARAIRIRQKAGNLAVGNRSLARRAARGLATAAVAGAALEAGSTVFSALGGEDVARRFATRGGRGTSQRARGVPFTPGTVVPTDSITHTWVANGVPFAQLADGRVMVRRKNGTIKTFRRPRPIVLGRNPGIRDISRAYKKIDTLLKVMRKHFPAQKTRTQSRAPHRSVDV